ncbi:uncharacterized protein LOC134530722 isoform X2 [Bacillus rossius redtenbacheri]|uniref:uncharacterized protein LOC134530722 isoform X2 n=1 Tax=Bacillus rossius redtenbacheri TaxID=93214 RepID=UPI002FDE6774
MSIVQENSQHSSSEAVKPVTSFRIERLKREDDEEQWISGEELCTEGSSDEEDATGRARKRGEPNYARRNHKAGKQACPAVASIPPTLSVELAPERAAGQGPGGDDTLTGPEEQQAEISWRPKRGSIKLPNLSLEGGGTSGELPSPQP